LVDDDEMLLALGCAVGGDEVSDRMNNECADAAADAASAADAESY